MWANTEYSGIKYILINKSQLDFQLCFWVIKVHYKRLINISFIVKLDCWDEYRLEAYREINVQIKKIIIRTSSAYWTI